jgi:hypothetical protein
METEWSTQPSCPFSDHILLSSPACQGAGLAYGQEAVSPLDSIGIFRKRAVSDVYPRREGGCPRFPTPPPPLFGFDRKAISVVPYCFGQSHHALHPCGNSE